MKTLTQYLHSSFSFHFKEIYQLAKLTVFTFSVQLTQFFQYIIATIFLEKIGNDALALYNVNISIYVIAEIGFIGIFWGVTTFIGHFHGAKHYHRLLNYLRQFHYIALLVIIFIFLILWNIEFFLLNHLKMPADFKSSIISFCKITSFTLSIQIFNQIYKAFLEGIKEIKILSLLSVSNLILYTFIVYYSLNNFSQSIYDAVIIIAYCHLILACLNLTIRLILYRKYIKKLFDKLNFKKKYLGVLPAKITEIIIFALPIGVTKFCIAMAFWVLPLILIKENDTILNAALQIVFNIGGLTFFIFLSISTALNIVITNALGDKRLKSSFFFTYFGIAIGLVLGSIITITFYFFPNFILGFYTDDKEVLLVAIVMLKMLALYQIGDVTQEVLAGILRAYHHTQFYLCVALTIYILLCLPLGWSLQKYVFSEQIMTMGYFVSYIICMWLSAVILFVYLQIRVRQFYKNN